MQSGVSNAPALAAMAIGVALVISGCGGAQAAHTHTGNSGYLQQLPVATAPTLTSRAPGSLKRGALPQPGVTQHVDSGGAALAVTLRSVIDPLKGAGADLPVGTRAVGVVFQIRSAGPKLYDSSATGDISIVVSSGVVTPVLATRGVCKTPVQDFDRYITAGEDRIGCVVFAVADDATLDAVRFSPHAHRLGRLTWAP